MATAGGRGQLVDGLAKRIKQARDAKGWSQADLAERMPGGREAALQVSHYECERRTPSAAALKDLAKALGVSSDWLLGLREKP
jgi:transcriptional regulator with XRE-family HTH domain